MPSPTHRFRPIGLAAGLLTLCGFLFLFLLMLSLGMRRGIIHDESQHLAAGALFGRHFILPYRDYPYFHTPYLAFIYGPIFRYCGSILLAGRLLNVEAGWLTCILLWYILWREARDQSVLVRWLLPAAGVLVLAADPIFRETFWRTWNHATATLFGLVAVAFALRPAENGRRWLWCGLFLGLAIGTRVTFAPLVAPLAVAAVWHGGRRVRDLLMLAAGTFVALIPCLITFAIAPARFIFGVYLFNSRVNVLFRESYHDPRITFRAKLEFLGLLLKNDMAMLLLVLMLAGLVAWFLVRRRAIPAPARYRLFIVLSLLPFAAFAALAASPSQGEYYYPLIPLVILAVGFAALPLFSARLAWMVLFLVLPACLSGPGAWNEYQHLAVLRHPAEWPPILIHQAGQEVAAYARPGQVLTFDPIYPLEGGLDTYPTLTTGYIEWRTEPFIAPADRERFGIMGPDNMRALLADKPPAAVLTITSSQYDAPLTKWAEAHNYVRRDLQPHGKLVDQSTIWTPSPFPIPQ